MANNLIFRAMDATEALEKVQNALGPDAYIIDINNVGNFVEITASKDEPGPQKRNKLLQAKKSPAFQKQSQVQFLPEEAVKPLGIAAYMSPSNPKPSLNDDAPSHVEVSVQEDLFAENVFRHVEDSQKSLRKPGESSRRTFFGDKINRTAPVSQIAPDMDPKPTKDTSDPNITQSMLAKGHETFVFGDLLNFGLSPAFIKKEFSIKEFDGSISRSLFTERLVAALLNPFGTSLLDDFGNLVFLGTPGAGKSTICAKLMHYYGTQYAAKPSVLHVTPEKLFEADRLRFYAKMFNFPFTRIYTHDNAALCRGSRQIVEIAWDKQMSFANYFAHNQKSYPSLKPLLVLPAETNHHTLKEVLRVCPMVRSVILNKCDFGRFSIRNLMTLYEKGYKIISLSGDRSVSKPLDIADAVMLHGFVEYTLDL